MKKFPKIGQFRNAIFEVNKHDTEANLTYNGTVKLHGTNAAIVVHPDGLLSYQSRNNELSLDNDNYGFVRHFEDKGRQKVWHALSNMAVNTLRLNEEDFPVTFFGEWCGEGVQGGVAISNLPKMFVIIGIRTGDEEGGTWHDIPDLLVGDRHHRSDLGIYSIESFPTKLIGIDFSKPQEVQNALIEMTNEIEAKCPVGAALGHEGTGEGVVWRCITPGWESSRFWFKVKGEKHSVTKVKKLAEVDVERMKTIDDFIEATVTEARLLQGIEYLREQGLELSQRSTGDYVRWVNNDVATEEADRIEASLIERKELGKPLADKARKWFFAWIDKQAGLAA